MPGSPWEYPFMSRPTTDDPTKYEHALREYQLATRNFALGTGVKKIDDFTLLLSWAIAQQRPGFQEGDVLGVAAAATGLHSSRSTMKQVVAQLMGRGLLVLEAPKSPYRIVSRTPVLHPNWLASATISATKELKRRGGESVIDEPLWIKLMDRTEYATLLKEALSASTDRAILASLRQAECKKRWHQARILVFRRLRFLLHDGMRRSWLHEVTYLALPASVEREVEERIRYLIDHKIHLVSLGSLLNLAEVKQLTNGRTCIGTGTIPRSVRPDMLTLAARYQIDVGKLLDTTDHSPSLLRWEYGHFAAKPVGLIAFSICHEDPTHIRLFAKDLDLVESTVGKRTRRVHGKESVSVAKYPLPAVVIGSYREDLRGLLTFSQKLRALGVQVLHPPLQPQARGEVSGFVQLSCDRSQDPGQVQRDVLSLIDQADAVILYTPSGRVGVSAALEVGYCVRANKPVLATTEPTDVTIRALIAYHPDALIQFLRKASLSSACGTQVQNEIG